MNTQPDTLSADDMEYLRKARQVQGSIRLLQEMVDEFIDPIVERAIKSENPDFMSRTLNAMDDCPQKSKLSNIFYDRIEKATKERLATLK